MATEELELVQEDRSWWHLRSWLRWCPTSPSALAHAERNILGKVWHLLETNFVPIKNGSMHIRTISLNKASGATPLVLVHGMGSGIGLWALNLESLSQSRPVYAFDVLGFGRSSRPSFSSDPILAETELVESIEEWREQMKLDKFVLLGHSLGGFLATSYAISYPQHVKHLLLIDPWGFPERPQETEKQQKLPRWIRFFAHILTPFNPMAGLRAAGPWGPSLVQRIRPDLLKKFAGLDEEIVAQYIYHCNAQSPTGESAFKSMSIPFGWAKNPMIRRLHELPKETPMTMIYGSRSWVDNGVGYETKYIRSDSYVDVQTISGAGHHVYVEGAEQVNEIVNRCCITDISSEDMADSATGHGTPPS